MSNADKENKEMDDAAASLGFDLNAGSDETDQDAKIHWEIKSWDMPGKRLKMN